MLKMLLGLRAIIKEEEEEISQEPKEKTNFVQLFKVYKA
jgi:hypothetical protein